MKTLRRALAASLLTLAVACAATTQPGANGTPVVADHPAPERDTSLRTAAVHVIASVAPDLEVGRSVRWSKHRAPALGVAVVEAAAIAAAAAWLIALRRSRSGHPVAHGVLANGVRAPPIRLA